MSDDQVVDISRRGVLSFDEACERVLVLKRLTVRYAELVERKMTQLESLSESHLELIHDIENEINILIHEWHGKVRRLGGIPKGLWLVDFDAGFGYYCWKFPEAELSYWHTYNEGFDNRKKIIVEDENEFVLVNESIVSLNL
ncbi:MAG: DUF2203 family protein [Bdellovibrionales bacterium]|nr:DUF2203 family protein [Bdellovibrionales bacterium]